MITLYVRLSSGSAYVLVDNASALLKLKRRIIIMNSELTTLVIAAASFLGEGDGNV